jgi:ABC-type siderophore export system fused ATPase/permease subunit
MQNFQLGKYEHLVNYSFALFALVSLRFCLQAICMSIAYFIMLTPKACAILQVYAVMSFLSLILPDNAIYFNSIREM